MTYKRTISPKHQEKMQEGRRISREFMKNINQAAVSTNLIDDEIKQEENDELAALRNENLHILERLSARLEVSDTMSIPNLRQDLNDLNENLKALTAFDQKTGETRTQELNPLREQSLGGLLATAYQHKSHSVSGWAMNLFTRHCVMLEHQEKFSQPVLAIAHKRDDNPLIAQEALKFARISENTTLETDIILHAKNIGLSLKDISDQDDDTFNKLNP